MSALVRGGLTAAAPQSRETVDLDSFACGNKKSSNFFIIFVLVTPSGRLSRSTSEPRPPSSRALVDGTFMFSRSTGETDDLLGGSGTVHGSGGSMRGTLTVNRGYLHYGDAPPPASSTGRRYQGGVSFEDTRFVDPGVLSSASSSDGEYSYVEDSSPMVRHAEGRRGTRRESSGLGGVSGARGDKKGSSSSSHGGLGVWSAVLVLAVLAVLSVVGLVGSGVVPAESLPLPAGMLNALQIISPGIAPKNEPPETLSLHEKNVADARAEHAATHAPRAAETKSRDEDDKEETKKKEEDKETKEMEEEEKKEEEDEKNDDDDDDDQIVLLGRDERGSRGKAPTRAGGDTPKTSVFDYDYSASRTPQ